MSQEKTAHQVGSIRQSVNAALRGFERPGFERRGWIELHDRAIAARQERALARFDGTDLSASRQYSRRPVDCHSRSDLRC